MPSSIMQIVIIFLSKIAAVYGVLTIHYCNEGGTALGELPGASTRQGNSTFVCRYKSSATHPDGLTWHEAIEYCNKYKYMLLYAFNYDELRKVLGGVQITLKDSISNLNQAAENQRLLFLSAHDRSIEGSVSVDLRLNHADSGQSFTWLLNDTAKVDSPYSIFRNQLPVNEVNEFLWSTDYNGNPDPNMIPSSDSPNGRTINCMAALIGDEGFQIQWVDCNSAKSNIFLCRREGETVEQKPCPMSDILSYQQATQNVQIVGFYFYSNTATQIYFTDTVARATDPTTGWLTEDSMKNIMIPYMMRIYFMVLCAPGWYISEVDRFDIKSISCQQGIDSEIKTELLCKHFDPCFENIELEYYKGTHKSICSGQGYCRPDKATLSATCICLSGWSGANCSEPEEPDPCVPNPCGEGQNCVRQQSDYYCECVGRLSANYHACSYDIDECLSNPCRNDGFCENQLNQFTCVCSPMRDSDTNEILKYSNGTEIIWEGIYCDIDPYDKCDERPCEGDGETDYMLLYGDLPNGTCLDLTNGFFCACNYPWSGTVCELYDVSNLIKAVSYSKQALIIIYFIMFILVSVSCMLLTIFRRKEIKRGVYKTNEMVIAEYEAEKKQQREKLMQYVEEAAYSSDEDNSKPGTKRETKSKRVRRQNAPERGPQYSGTGSAKLKTPALVDATDQAVSKNSIIEAVKKGSSKAQSQLLLAREKLSALIPSFSRLREGEQVTLNDLPSKVVQDLPQSNEVRPLSSTFQPTQYPDPASYGLPPRDPNMTDEQYYHYTLDLAKKNDADSPSTSHKTKVRRRGVTKAKKAKPKLTKPS